MADAEDYLRSIIAAGVDAAIVGVVDELEPGKEWEKQADACIGKWSGFLTDYKSGWELWPAVRACTRKTVERSSKGR